jgi:hypothetical protein
MSSPAQILANQANSRQSIGPSTAEGKRTASSNSMKHGLTSKQVVIPGEDPAEFEDLRTGLHTDWKPANTQESVLVDQIAQHAWRLNRARRLETASFDRFMPNLAGATRTGRNGRTEIVPVDPEEALATAFHTNTQAFENLRRYEAAIERSYYKAITELRKLQQERRAQAPAEPIGFVSQPPQLAPLAAATLNPTAHGNCPSHGLLVKLECSSEARGSGNTFSAGLASPNEIIGE